MLGYGRHPLGTCPKCGFATQRVPKRLIDRLMGRLAPLERHICLSPACDWVGNVRLNPGSAAANTAQG